MGIVSIENCKRFLRVIYQRISFMINTISGHAISNSIYDYAAPQHSEYKAAFAFIDTYNEITRCNAKILSDIVERKSILHKRQDELASVLVATNKNINNYVAYQKEECSQLVAKKNQCESIFITLEESAVKFNDTVTKLEKKLGYSAESIRYCSESEALIKDINTSFRDAYNKNKDEVMQNIERILSSLNTLAYKCSSMQLFPKSYNNAISMYSGKIASVLQAFEYNNIIALADISKRHDNSDIKSMNANISNKPVLPGRKKFCSKCGTKIEYIHTKCPHCGSSVYVEGS
jgi:hypothetical protein